MHASVTLTCPTRSINKRPSRSNSVRGPPVLGGRLAACVQAPGYWSFFRTYHVTRRSLIAPRAFMFPIPFDQLTLPVAHALILRRQLVPHNEMTARALAGWDSQMALKNRKGVIWGCSRHSRRRSLAAPGGRAGCRSLAPLPRGLRRPGDQLVISLLPRLSASRVPLLAAPASLDRLLPLASNTAADEMRHLRQLTGSSRGCWPSFAHLPQRSRCSQ